MGLKFIPKIVYGGTTLQLTQPQKLWTPYAKPYGGSNVSDSGVPEAFIIRRDQLVKIEPRFTEAEWAGFDAFMNYAQSGNSFTYWFDSNDASTSHAYYLFAPSLGDGEVTPTRDPDNRHIYSLQMTIRTTDLSLISVLT